MTIQEIVRIDPEISVMLSEITPDEDVWDAFEYEKCKKRIKRRVGWYAGKDVDSRLRTSEAYMTVIEEIEARLTPRRRGFAT